MTLPLLVLAIDIHSQEIHYSQSQCHVTPGTFAHVSHHLCHEPMSSFVTIQSHSEVVT